MTVDFLLRPMSLARAGLKLVFVTTLLLLLATYTSCRMCTQNLPPSLSFVIPDDFQALPGVRVSHCLAMSGNDLPNVQDESYHDLQRFMPELEAEFTFIKNCL